MTDTKRKLLLANHILGKTMHDIEFICDRARIHYVEEKDVLDIIQLIKECRGTLFELESHKGSDPTDIECPNCKGNNLQTTEKATGCNDCGWHNA